MYRIKTLYLKWLLIKKIILKLIISGLLAGNSNLQKPD